MAIDTDVERYADPQAFAREVNLPLLGVARVPAIPAGASVSQLLTASAIDQVAPIVDGLVETRRSLTLRTLLLAGFPHDPECFAVGLALGREWSRRGLKIAVVDLDFWNPTIVRPADQPNEGFVDVLEYGCSFGRVAWEIVADRLWVVGPGSHPPDEDRVAEHPDWPRAARVFSGRVDVALFVAPLLDRRGFTGKLSKRMDAALLAASVERTARADLRDSFLELWGSDAPMIGCVGIEEAGASPAAARGGTAADARAAGSGLEAEAEAGPVAAALDATPGAAAPTGRLGEDEGSGDAGRGDPLRGEPGYDSDGMVATIEREVKRGEVRRKAHGGFGRSALWIGIAAVIALAAAIFDLVHTSDLSPGSGAVQAPQQAGEEPVGAPPEAPLRSDLGPGAPGGLPDVGAAATPAPAAATPPKPGAAPPAKPPAAAPTSAAPTSAAPTSAAPPPAGDATGPFRVHVASFRSEGKVQGIVKDLKSKGLDAWYEAAADLPGWYRVFVGRFKTEEEARSYAVWLLDRRLVDRAHSYPSTAR